MVTLGIPLWEILLRTAVVYVAIYAGLRIMGKRELGHITVFDLVVILLIANAVQNSMVGSDVSLMGGLLAALVLLVMNRVIAGLRMRGEFWGRLLEGTPTVLIQNGQFIMSQLRREGLDRSEVEMIIREHGIESVSAVKLAVLEVDGSISIVPSASPVVRTRQRVRQFRDH